MVSDGSPKHKLQARGVQLSSSSTPFTFGFFFQSSRTMVRLLYHSLSGEQTEREEGKMIVVQCMPVNLVGRYSLSCDIVFPIYEKEHAYYIYSHLCMKSSIILRTLFRSFLCVPIPCNVLFFLCGSLPSSFAP